MSDPAIPPFQIIFNADCLEILRGMADGTVDSVVCDPPYHLTSIVERFGKEGSAAAKVPEGGSGVYARSSKGFMGQTWDGGDIAFRVELWREVLRVLKPGGYLLAFSGTRTYHRMAVAIEDAGFEVRDQIGWHYGCLSEDTEILVDGVWSPYHKATAGSRVLCYDVERDAYSWESVERLYTYEYDDIAYCIRSDDTDQIVSRNHRCLVLRDGAWRFAVAEEVAREQEARVPVLQAMRGLLDSVGVPESYSGAAEPLLSPVPIGEDSCAAKEDPDGGARRDDEDLMRRLPCGSMARSRARSSDEPGLLQEVQRGYSGGSLEEVRASWTSRLDGGVAGVLSREDVGGVESRMEGRGDVQAEQGELRRAEVRSMPAGVFRDGAEGRLRHGASPSGGAGFGEVPLTDGGGASYRPQHAEQRAVEPHALSDERGAQAVRGAGHTGTTLARVTPVHYVGTVWCVKVPTGAFVARRNGKVFVTGNSGFPKSLNVSKAIDATQLTGASHSRNIKQANRIRPGESRETATLPNNGMMSGERRGSATNDNPATDDARRWSGWGTALKPAWEPICVARKPLAGTVAANVLKYGTGAMNIDANRIPTTESLNGGTYSGGKRTPMPGDTRTSKSAGRYGEDGRLNPEDFKQPEGRWPANLIMSHDVNCDEDGCVAGCPCAAMDAQSGILTSGKPSGIRGRSNHIVSYADVAVGSALTGFGDTGGASRFFNNLPIEAEDFAPFFYTAKASRKEREAGCENLPEKTAQEAVFRDPESAGAKNPRAGANRGAGAPLYYCTLCDVSLQGGRAAKECAASENGEHVPEARGTTGAIRNLHPTVKPLSVMSWLVTLVTPPNGVVMDPFMGSGTTGIAAVKNGFSFIGCEQSAEYVAIAEARIRHHGGDPEVVAATTPQENP